MCNTKNNKKQHQSNRGLNCLNYINDTFPVTKRTSLHLAARNNNVKCIELLVRAGSDLEARDKDNQTALSLAAWKQHCKSIKILLDLGARRTDVLNSIHNRQIRKCLKGNAMFG